MDKHIRHYIINLREAINKNNFQESKNLTLKMGVSVAKYNIWTSAMRCQMRITILNTIGEILDHLALEQLRRHLECSLNIGQLKSAYRLIHITKNAMSRVMNDLLTAANSKSPSVLRSLDVSAVFDTLDHHRLLRIKELFGSGYFVLEWLQLYLTCREHFMAVDGRWSSAVKLSAVEPRGSLLEPLLFTICKNASGVCRWHLAQL